MIVGSRCFSPGDYVVLIRSAEHIRLAWARNAVAARETNQDCRCRRRESIPIY
jgi:hypothetical protein